ncbi:MAG: hypothetical protein ABIA74_02655 [bacterium]
MNKLFSLRYLFLIILFLNCGVNFLLGKKITSFFEKRQAKSIKVLEDRAEKVYNDMQKWIAKQSQEKQKNYKIGISKLKDYVDKTQQIETIIKKTESERTEEEKNQLNILKEAKKELEPIVKEQVEGYEASGLKGSLKQVAGKATGLLSTKKSKAAAVGGGTGMVGLGGLGTASVGLAGLGTAGAAILEAGDVTEFTSWDESLLGKDEDKTEMPVGEVSGEEFKEPEITKPIVVKPEPPEIKSEETLRDAYAPQGDRDKEKITTPKDLLKLSDDQELSVQDANDLLNLVAAYVRQNILPKSNKLILESAEPIKFIDLHGDEISFNGKNFIKTYQEKMQEAEKAYQEAEKYSKELYDKKQIGEDALRPLDSSTPQQVRGSELVAQGDRDDKEVILAFEKTQKAKEEIGLAKSEMEKTLKSRSIFISVDGQNTVYNFIQQSVNLIKQHTPKFEEIDLIKIFGFLPEGITKKDILTILPVAVTKEEPKKTEITAEQKSEKEDIVKPEVIVEKEKVEAGKKVEEEKEPEPEKSKVVEWVKSKIKKIGEKGKELVGEELEDFKKKHLEEKPEDSTTTRIFKSVTKDVLTGTGKEDVEPVEPEVVN